MLLQLLDRVGDRFAAGVRVEIALALAQRLHPIVLLGGVDQIEIQRESLGDTARIGSVSLRDSHAHVRVPEELVEKIIAGVHGTLHNDHNVTVERARA